ncbi:MAG: DUF4830 domain-containing protein [Oscillospiraceae bacterium]
MFVVSIKANFKKIALTAFMFFAVILSVIFLLGSSIETMGKVSIHLSNNNERIEFIQQFGWKIEFEPLEIVDVTIPKEFNDVYKKYNSLQKKQNFNLEKYKGKTVKRYTYTVTNYKGEEYVRANLLIYNNTLIGGDISSIKLNGFMHGFNPKYKL